MAAACDFMAVSLGTLSSDFLCDLISGCFTGLCMSMIPYGPNLLPAV